MFSQKERAYRRAQEIKEISLFIQPGLFLFRTGGFASEDNLPPTHDSRQPQ